MLIIDNILFHLFITKEVIKIAPKPENLNIYENSKYDKLKITNAYRDNRFVFFDAVCDCGNELNHIQKSNFFKRKFFSCYDCYFDLIERNVKLDELIGEKYNHLEIIKAYRKIRNNGNSIIIVNCLCDCGEIRENVQLTKLREGTVYSCKKCAKSISSMEMFISQILKNNNIDFIHQKRFSDCKDIFELPFDFYLPKLNILIEYDGSQHYEKNHFYNSLEDFEKIKRHDEIKTMYAEQHNIMLVRFNYKQNKDEIEKELLSIMGCENRKKLLA